MQLKKPAIRFWIGVMVFFTTYINYTIRVNLSVSIIAMAEKRGNKSVIPECTQRKINATADPFGPITTTVKPEKKAIIDDAAPSINEKHFHWDEPTQGFLLAAYFYGNLISSIPGGFIAEWMGPKRTTIFCHVISGLLNVAMVPACNWMKNTSWSLPFLLRLLMGLFGGCVEPALGCLISRWAPPMERGRFVGTFLGSSMGIFVTWPVVSFLTPLFGWASGFYFVTCQCLIFCVLFWLVVEDYPEEHKWISLEERIFIMTSVRGVIDKTKKVPPYMEIIASVPVWAVMVSQFGLSWGFYVMMTGVPKFLVEVHGLDLNWAGILASLPFIAKIFFGFLFGFINDYLIAHNYYTATNISKWCVIFSHLIPALCLMMMLYVDCDWVKAIVILGICHASNSAFVVTTLRNIIDIAPNYTGTVFGIVTPITTIAGIISPSVTAVLIETEPVYDWDEALQGILLGAYFIGYVISCMPGGMLAEWIGPFNTIFYAHFLTAVINIVLVFGLKWIGHWSILWVSRFMLGLMAGVIYPALQCLISKWAPPAEKGKFVGALMGNTLGTCITWPVVGWITENWGWAWGHHALSGQCFVYCIIFWFVTSDSPQDHRWISAEERDFIINAQGGAVDVAKKKKLAPYVDIFKSGPFWALCIVHWGNLWGLYLQVTAAPKFISRVLGFDLKSSGGLAALPFLTRLCTGMTFGALGDVVLKWGKISKTNTRKAFVLFSHLIPALCLLSMNLIECQSTIAVALLVLAQGSNGAAVVTNLQNPQDLAPNYAGTIFGIISFIGGFTGFICPAITGALTDKNNGIFEWHMVFTLGGATMMVCGIVFIVFGTAERQPWNDKEGAGAAAQAT